MSAEAKNMVGNAVWYLGGLEYGPGKEGMVHISKIANRRLERVEDAGIEVGTVVRVKYLGLDKKGRMDFSIKDAD